MVSSGTYDISNRNELCILYFIDAQICTFSYAQRYSPSQNKTHSYRSSYHNKRCCFQYFNLQVILFNIDYTIVFTNLHKLFCQFINWTNWIKSGKLMDYCWISCQNMADMKKVYDNLIIINLVHALKLKIIPNYRLRNWI